ncbi:unnamed protein product [Pylaiella littoralis]
MTIRLRLTVRRVRSRTSLLSRSLSYPRYIFSTEFKMEEARSAEAVSGGTAAVVQMAIGTSIFRRVIKVAGLGIPPMYLLVVVSQWHNTLVVRCYDFISGETREVERSNPDLDAALILEFKDMAKLDRDMQLQVMLDSLEVFEPRREDQLADSERSSQPCASAPATWLVRFAEQGSANIVVADVSSHMYDAQVDEQMAAAAAEVDKRREDNQRAKQAARDKDRRAREKREKCDAKRREMQAKRRKGAGGTRGNKRQGRTTRGGGGGGGRADAKGRGTTEDISDGGSGGESGDETRDG